MKGEEAGHREQRTGGDGGCSERHRRLCRLITGSLWPYSTSSVFRGRPADSSLDALAKETERDLLITLSSVCRKIQQWKNQLNITEADQEKNPSLESSCFMHSDEAAKEGHSCLGGIVSLLVSLLTNKSSYAQHLVGKVLVAAFHFLAKSGGSWVIFLHLIWISFEASLRLILFPTKAVNSEHISDNSLKLNYVKYEMPETYEDFDCDTAICIALLQPNLMKASYPIVTHIVRVLRDTFKLIKVNHDDLVEVYMHLAVCYLSNLHWDSLSNVHGNHIVRDKGMTSSTYLIDGEIRSANSLYLFFGAILQLFCSLIDPNDSEGTATFNNITTYSKFANLVPKILSCCFSKQDEFKDMHIFRYLRHKSMMLMIRFSFVSHWRCSISLLWLRSLKDYFEDLLYQPISKCHARHGNSLPESPFCLSSTDEKTLDIPCSCHLQRQAIFLFLKCCLTLMDHNGETALGCTCVTSNPSISCEVLLSGKGCYYKGLTELHDWLTRHASLDNIVDRGNYTPPCSKFSLSLLQLYLDEDDMLFAILLQLLDASFLNMQEENIERNMLLMEMGSEITSWMTNIFHPIHLFHLFLSLLHYDQMVLLDYLISKDTGIQCIQYLLRCLRVVCRSWPVFLKFSVCEDDIKQESSQKKSGNMAGKDSTEKIKLASSSGNDRCSSKLTVRRNKRRRDGGSMRHNTGHQTFESARNCLLSLKTSIEDLHRKNLFPYNPTALLRRSRSRAEQEQKEKMSCEVDVAFFQECQHRPKPNITEAGGIPLIDLSLLSVIDPSEIDAPQALKVLLGQIETACRDWGFFQVINHGVPLELLERVQEASKKFFALTLEEKHKVSRDEENPFGYYDTEHTKNIRDWKEVFDFTVEDSIKIPAFAGEESVKLQALKNKWPTNPSELRAACEEYARGVDRLAFKLLELIALTLKLPAKQLNHHFKDQLSFIRLNHYPPCPVPHLALGVGRHKDAGALTILAQDDVGGLDVKRKTDGEWIRVKPIPNSYIINIGDIIQVWSNEKYESPEHRVSVNSERERFSIPFFFNPAYDVVVKPLEELTSAQNPPKYEEYNWGEFFKTRKNSNFKKLDAENIQIYHFRKNTHQ